MNGPGERLQATWSISKAITVQASRTQIWSVLTEPKAIRAWLSDADLEVSADWTVGGAVTSQGDWHGHFIENRSRVLAVEPGQRLVYTHWSSLTQVPDREENHTRIELELAETTAGVALTVKQENLLTVEIYGHWNFYWNMALGRIKRLAETGEF